MQAAANGQDMDAKDIKYDYLRGCTTRRKQNGELLCRYDIGACKLAAFDWLGDISPVNERNIVEVRFKNTRKGFYRNATNQMIREGDIVVVEAATGHDVGIVTLTGAVVDRQLKRHKINPDEYEFKRIYRKAKTLDIERWQEAIGREYETMIRARQIAAGMGLNMKIGDVEFQGDGTKAIFYYIADERVDFRQLIKVFVEQFRIRIEMKQIGARQEAGLIGGIGACGQPLCCSRFMSEFKSITTISAKCQDLSLNPLKLAGQCGKLKCCINYEAAVYIDAHKSLPKVNGPLEFEDGPAYLVKTDTLKGVMWFSYDPNSMANMHPLNASDVEKIIKMNRSGVRPVSLIRNDETSENEFMSAVGEGSISRFDEDKSRKKKKNGRKKERPRPSRDNAKPAESAAMRQEPASGAEPSAEAAAPVRDEASENPGRRHDVNPMRSDSRQEKGRNRNGGRYNKNNFKGKNRDQDGGRRDGGRPRGNARPSNQADAESSIKVE